MVGRRELELFARHYKQQSSDIMYTQLQECSLVVAYQGYLRRVHQPGSLTSDMSRDQAGNMITWTCHVILEVVSRDILLSRRQRQHVTHWLDQGNFP